MNRLYVAESPASSLLRGWGISFLLHGFAIAGSIWVVSEIKPVVPKDPFKWDIALVQSIQPEPVQEAAGSPPQPTPPPVVKARSKPVNESRPIEAKPVETRPITQVVQTQTVQRVERTIDKSVAQAVQPTTVEKDVRRPEEVVTQAGSYAVERSVLSREEAVVAAAVSTPVERESVQAPVTQSRAEQAPTPVTPAPVQEVKVRPEVSRPVEAPAPPSPAPASPSPAPVAPTAQTPVVQHMPVQSMPGTRADFGWLKDLLARKIKEVKRYPHSARLNHWEGKVIVHAVIKEDGNLADLRVHESSGHDILDEAALETMRQSCPLHLNHPLGRPQVAIRIPISYTLND